MSKSVMSFIKTCKNEEVQLNDNICNVVGGDFDYVCDPSILNTYNDITLIKIEEKLHNYLERMEKSGVSLVSIYLRKEGMTEIEALTFLGRIMNQHSELGYIVHYFEPRAIDGLLKEYTGIPLLYSLTAEKTSLSNGLSIAKNKKCPMIIQPVDDNGIGICLERRVKIIESIVHTFTENHIEEKYIYVDPLSPTVYFKPCSLDLSIKTLEYCNKRGIKTILWPENTARGYKEENNYIAECYTSMAIGSSLNLAVISLNKSHLLTVVQNSNMIKRGVNCG
jgi:hypothetical protein